MSNDEASPRKGDRYRHPDGTVEVVFAVEDGRVLTFREYGDGVAFADAVEEATYVGIDEAVEGLPDAAAVEEELEEFDGE